MSLDRSVAYLRNQDMHGARLREVAFVAHGAMEHGIVNAQFNEERHWEVPDGDGKREKTTAHTLVAVEPATRDGDPSVLLTANQKLQISFENNDTGVKRVEVIGAGQEGVMLASEPDAGNPDTSFIKGSLIKLAWVGGRLHAQAMGDNPASEDGLRKMTVAVKHKGVTVHVPATVLLTVDRSRHDVQRIVPHRIQHSGRPDVRTEVKFATAFMAHAQEQAVGTNGHGDDAARAARAVLQTAGYVHEHINGQTAKIQERLAKQREKQSEADIEQAGHKFLAAIDAMRRKKPDSKAKKPEVFVSYAHDGTPQVHFNGLDRFSAQKMFGVVEHGEGGEPRRRAYGFGSGDLGTYSLNYRPDVYVAQSEHFNVPSPLVTDKESDHDAGTIDLRSDERGVDFHTRYEISMLQGEYDITLQPVRANVGNPQTDGYRPESDLTGLKDLLRVAARGTESAVP